LTSTERTFHVNAPQFTAMFAPCGVGLTDRAPDAHVDAMRCIEDDFFADAQPATGEYGLG
jgi:hypothetical protein